MSYQLLSMSYIVHTINFIVYAFLRIVEEIF